MQAAKALNALRQIQSKKIFGLEVTELGRRFTSRPALEDAQVVGDTIVLPTMDRLWRGFIPVYPHLFIANYPAKDVDYVGDHAYDILKLHPLYKSVEEVDGRVWECTVERVDGVRFRSVDTFETAILLNLEVNPGITYGGLLSILYDLVPDDMPEKKDAGRWKILEIALAQLIGMLAYEASLIEII